MTTRTQTKPWDFSQVLQLVNALSTPENNHRDRSENDGSYEAPAVQSIQFGKDRGAVDRQDFASTGPSLGNFGKVWQYLGTPQSPSVPEPVRSADIHEANNSLPNKLGYASDGATYFKALSKLDSTMQWEDPPSAEEPIPDAVTDRSASPDSPTLTKSQRKNKNRKERKAKEAPALAIKKATVSMSKADGVPRPTPARKASAHMGAGETPKRHNLRPRDASGRAVTAMPPSTPKAALKEKDLVNSSGPSSKPDQPGSLGRPGLAPETPSARRPSASKRQQSNPASTTARTQSPYDALHNRPAQQWPVTTPSQAFATQYVPSTVQPPSNTAAQAFSSQFSSVQQAVKAVQAATQSRIIAPRVPTKKQLVIEPKVVRSGEDRDWALLMKLIGDFWEDRAQLVRPMNLTTHNNDPKGIHVFVDASNIFIGFNDQLKRARNIPLHWHVPPVNLSFDALALLMERRRPVAKRILAGSMPRLPAFDKAEAVGYECSLLEKVYKARELTDRQIYFQERDGAWRNNRKGVKAPTATDTAIGTTKCVTNGHGSGSGSGSETTAAPQYAPAKMIEQGVDEILHLKILESIVDSDEPSTMVLATGDAAQAEYSQGFMAMAERALKKGWKVELVSWSKNISMMYTRKEWTQRWREGFRIVYLDDYAEELLDM